MDGRSTWTDCDEAGDYVVPNVLSPRDLVSRPDVMDETVPHIDSNTFSYLQEALYCAVSRFISNNHRQNKIKTHILCDFAI